MILLQMKAHKCLYLIINSSNNVSMAFTNILLRYCDVFNINANGKN